MKADWLEASSAEQMRRLVSAINTLSIHAKLQIGGKDNPAPVADVEGARESVIEFIRRFQMVVENADRNRDGAIVGADPQISGLATQYLELSRQVTTDAPVFALPLDEALEITRSGRAEDLQLLVLFLRDLRSLILQLPQTDVTELLSGF